MLKEGLGRASPPGSGSDEWLERTLALAYALSETEANADRAGRQVTQPAPGDLVILPARFSPRVRIAVEVSEGSSGFNVAVVDAEVAEGVRRFSASKVRTVKWNRG